MLRAEVGQAVHSADDSEYHIDVGYRQVCREGIDRSVNALIAMLLHVCAERTSYNHRQAVVEGGLFVCGVILGCEGETRVAWLPYKKRPLPL